MNDKQPTCSLCGEPMPDGEETFRFHGYSGPRPKPPLPAATATTPQNTTNPKTPDFGGISPQNTSNSLSELDDILDDALNTIQAYVQDEIQDDNGYPPFYGDGETFERVKSKAIAAINRLYIKRSDVVEAVNELEEIAWVKRGELDSHENIINANAIRRVLGLSGEQEGE